MERIQGILEDADKKLMEQEMAASPRTSSIIEHRPPEQELATSPQSRLEFMARRESSKKWLRKSHDLYHYTTKSESEEDRGNHTERREQQGQEIKQDVKAKRNYLDLDHIAVQSGKYLNRTDDSPVLLQLVILKILHWFLHIIQKKKTRTKEYKNSWIQTMMMMSMMMKKRKEKERRCGRSSRTY